MCENKGADQLRGNREADQRICFCHTDSTIPLLMLLGAIFCDCTARFFVGPGQKPQRWFSHKAAHTLFVYMCLAGVRDTGLKVICSKKSSSNI